MESSANCVLFDVDSLQDCRKGRRYLSGHKVFVLPHGKLVLSWRLDLRWRWRAAGAMR
jgi:hypothetical protein